MKDKEILKALECCKPSNEDGCLNCPLNSVSLPECCEILCEETINLINRQQAEIETLKAHEEKEHQHCKNVCEPKYKAKIERLEIAFVNLQKTAKYWKNKCDELVEELTTAKAETVKDFAKKLCDGRVSNDPVVIAVKVELKEMVGDAE